MPEYHKLAEYICSSGLRMISFLIPFAWMYCIVDVWLHKKQNVVGVASAEVNGKDVEHAQNILTDFGLG